ncbi:hypothetical protein HD806DRAFT_439344 [Xylariaceae sp. AK1471]|nr:hypothetical protein HD806DRAFT_439344 [Xylariaceae sp. AK1471]
MSSSADADLMASTDKFDTGPDSSQVIASTSSQTQEHIEKDDESEWEYEYSATETETFYVTLDLSKADFRAQEQVKSDAFTPRGAWPTHKASELFTNRRKATDRASQNSAASSAASSDAERDDEDQPEMSREGRGKQPSSAQNDGGVNGERVQILDLHSENPIISYKGRVFAGQWCENTTTELLMTRRDETSSLPILRHLPDGVDLLAASCSRINVIEQKVKPKVNNRGHRASAHLPQTVIPPVDLKASQERIDQRNFLADLIAIKRRRGETDDVTVIARSMQGKRAKIKTKGTRPHRRGRWAHTDKLQAARGLEERPRRAGRKKGSGRGRGKWALFPLEAPARDATSVASSVADSLADGESGVSTPTPSRWDELEEGQVDSPARMDDLMEADEDDEQDEEEAEYDDNNDFEEDEDDDQGGMDEDED